MSGVDSLMEVGLSGSNQGGIEKKYLKFQTSIQKYTKSQNDRPPGKLVKAWYF